MASSPRTVEAPAGTERIGAIACWGFGVAWAIWGLTGISGSAALAILGVVAIVLAALTAAVACRASESPAKRRLPAGWKRRYHLLVLAQFVSIFLASLTLGRMGYPEAIPVAICLIVGIHFFPLAGIFDIEPYRLTAIALCAVAVTGGGLLAITGAATVRAVVGLGAAAVLWASAVWTSQAT